MIFTTNQQQISFFKWKSENKLVENLGMVVNSLCSCQYLPDSVNTSVSDWRSIRCRVPVCAQHCLAPEKTIELEMNFRKIWSFTITDYGVSPTRDLSFSVRWVKTITKQSEDVISTSVLVSKLDGCCFQGLISNFISWDFPQNVIITSQSNILRLMFYIKFYAVLVFLYSAI